MACEYSLKHLLKSSKQYGVTNINRRLWDPKNLNQPCVVISKVVLHSAHYVIIDVKAIVSPLHCVPYPGRLLADGHVEGVNVGHLGGDDGRQFRVSQLPREEGASLARGEGEGRC